MTLSELRTRRPYVPWLDPRSELPPSGVEVLGLMISETGLPSIEVCVHWSDGVWTDPMQSDLDFDPVWWSPMPALPAGVVA